MFTAMIVVDVIVILDGLILKLYCKAGLNLFFKVCLLFKKK